MAYKALLLSVVLHRTFKENEDGRERKKGKGVMSTEESKSVFGPSAGLESGFGEQPAGYCTVCSQVAHGKHFGVLACRACAAFYRRSIVLGKQYHCRNASGHCKISEDERYLCRLCRFRRCLAVGMKENNVQRNRDKSKSVREAINLNEEDKREDFSNPSSESTPLVESECSPTQLSPTAHSDDAVERRCKTHRKSSAERFLFSNILRGTASKEEHTMDISELVKKLRNLFEKPWSNPVSVRMNLMQRMLSGMHRLRRHQSRDPKFISSLGIEECKKNWEKQLYDTATWTMYSQQFAQLPCDEKWTLFKASWSGLHRLERLHKTVDIYGQSLLDEYAKGRLFLVVSDEFVVDCFSFSIRTSGEDNYADYVKQYMKLFEVRLLEEVTRPLIELAITDYELVYMLCQLFWHVEGRNVSTETLRVAEEYRRCISAELHDYYLLERGSTNYASRLMRLMNIVNDLENILEEREKMLKVAFVLDVFKMSIVDPRLGFHTTPFLF